MFFDCAGIYGSVNVVDDPEDAISHFFIFHASVNVKMSSGDRDIYWILVLSNSMTELIVAQEVFITPEHFKFVAFFVAKLSYRNF
jgi:hypothetical protein